MARVSAHSVSLDGAFDCGYVLTSAYRVNLQWLFCKRTCSECSCQCKNADCSGKCCKLLLRVVSHMGWVMTLCYQVRLCVCLWARSFNQLRTDFEGVFLDILFGWQYTARRRVLDVIVGIWVVFRSSGKRSGFFWPIRSYVFAIYFGNVSSSGARTYFTDSRRANLNFRRVIYFRFRSGICFRSDFHIRDSSGNTASPYAWPEGHGKGRFYATYLARSCHYGCRMFPGPPT